MPSRILVALRVRVTPERAFEAFTSEIGQWWQPNGLFQFTRRGPGRLAFTPGPDGRLMETHADGEVFEVGRITVWDPPTELAFHWRQASFTPDQTTHVRVRFESVDLGTRVTVEHIGWDGIARDNAARHGFPLDVFQLRHAEWWRALLEAYRNRLTAHSAPVGPPPSKVVLSAGR